MRNLVILLTAFAATFGIAQREMGPKPSRASWVYEESRYKVTEPTFGLKKVKHLIKTKLFYKDASETVSLNALPKPVFDKLSVKEKFTYCMLNGEEESQVCDSMSALIGEEHMIFASPVSEFGPGQMWSDRQKAFFQAHRGTCLVLLRKTIQQRHQVGCNLLNLVLLLNEKKMVPELVKFYNEKHQAQDILSTLLTLMKNGNYKPLTKEPWYGKLYGNNAGFGSYIAATKANIDTIERLALAYAKS